VTPVALLLEHDAPAVAAIVGVLKAGKFYSALEASFPLARNKAVLAKLGADVLICDRANLILASEIAGSTCRILLYDEIRETDALSPPPDIAGPQTPYGVFFTSGSTGEPKGLLWTHRLALQRILVDVRDGGISPEDRHSLMSSFTFPAPSTDLGLALLSGASLHLYDAVKFGGLYLGQWLAHERITMWRPPVALYRQLIAALGEHDMLPDVRLICLSGARVLRQDIERAWPHLSPACQVIHRYTITEAGMVARWVIGRATPLPDEVLPAGLAMPGKAIRILDDDHRDLPPGEVGEIAVHSCDLPRYWNDPSGNEQRYRPIENDPRAAMCLTGDRGRLRADGALEIVGRSDERVKVRGYGVELPAVERVLRNLPSVKDAAVVAAPDATGETAVVAYVVPDPCGTPASGPLRALLAAELPHYMLPSKFVVVASLPLTGSGKVDRNLLRRAAHADPETVSPDAVFETDTESKLAEIWRAVLNLRQVGRRDNFFEIGGQSLAAARVVARVNELFRIDLPLGSIYGGPTLADLAAAVDKVRTRGATADSAGQDSSRTKAVEEAMRRLDFL
jgi:acyl-coenzyme A synthetase/AMP-(fatty) acid ligase